MKRYVGIDLGTTNSCAAVMEGGEPCIIPNSEGQRTTPSVVAFTKKGERLVGEPAKRQAALNADRTIFSIKRDMGSDHRINIDGHKFSPQEISAVILRKLKKDAQDYLGEPVTDAVITVPAYFNDAQRQATKDAGRIAGLNVMRIINEPTSAAFAYGLNNEQAQKVLVYDLGGGTFDVSIIEIGDGLIEVLSTSGDNHLGGDDFDNRLADYMADEFKKKEGADIRSDPAAMQRVREEAERVKKELSTAATANVSLPFLSVVHGTPHHLEMTVSRAQFEQLTHDLIERTSVPVQNAMRDAGITARDLSKVLLVGGSTRIPAVQEKVRRMLGKEPSRNINPDECVAMGAAIQAGKLGGDLPAASAANAMILMDVTPLSLSIETVGGIATKLIDRNTTIPAKHSQIFTTASNFQTSVEIKVYQGERQFVKDNTLIGNFRLGGIKRAMAGMPQIEVTFDIDVNGILTVSARDLGTGKAQHITITSNSNLSEDEIQAAIHDAEVYESEDGERRKYFDLHSQAENLAAMAERNLRAEKKNLTRQDKHEIKSALSALKKSLVRLKPLKMNQEDADTLQSETDRLQELTDKYFRQDA